MRNCDVCGAPLTDENLGRTVAVVIGGHKFSGRICSAECLQKFLLTAAQEFPLQDLFDLTD